MKIGYVRVSTQEQNTIRQEVMKRLDMKPRTFYRKIKGVMQMHWVFFGFAATLAVLCIIES